MVIRHGSLFTACLDRKLTSQFLSFWEWSYLKEMRSHFDLFAGGANFLGVQRRFTSEVPQMVALGELAPAMHKRTEIQKL